jgi:hypothetical protein
MGMRRRRLQGAVAAAALVAALGTAQPARAGYLEDSGWGVLTALTNVFYMPAKVVYATTGAITGGLAYGLTGGDLQTAENIWVPAMGGTYVVTPRMLQGEDPIAFAGSTTSGATADASDTKGLQEQQLGGT